MLKFRLLFGLVCIVWGWWLVIPDDHFRVVFCNVGQGDAVLVTKGYFQILIDTGPKNGGVGVCLGRNMPLGDKKIELVIISHQDSDHAGGLERVLGSYKVERLSEQKNDTNGLYYGDQLSYGRIVFKVLYPDYGLEPRENDSVVGLLEYGEVSILLSGDVDALVEKSILGRVPNGVGVDLLKVSHHGSKGASSDEWLRKISPFWSVISVGKNNFGHPSNDVLSRLKRIGSMVKRTDKDGDIVFVY